MKQSSNPLRVVVVGAGAIGGVAAAWLADQPDVQLSVLARGATLDTLRRDGLQLTDANGSRRWQVACSDNPKALGKQDLVLVAVKAQSLASVAPAVNALLDAEGTALVAMNGVPWWFFQGFGGECQGLALESVDPGGAIAAAIPTRQVVGCVVHMSCQSTAPGQVRHVNGRGLIIGTPSGGADARLDQLAALLGHSGFDATISDQIQRDIWFKLWGNMTMNPVSALTGATCDRILADPLVRGFASAVMLEAQAIGQRIGCGIAQTPVDRHAVTAKLGAFKTSMLQDVEAGRSIELDALVGSVREIGQHLGQATPHIDTLLGLTRLMAQGRGLYPL